MTERKGDSVGAEGFFSYLTSQLGNISMVFDYCLFLPPANVVCIAQSVERWPH